MTKSLPRIALLAAFLTGALSACGGDGGGTVRKTTLMASGWVPINVSAVPGDPIDFTCGLSKCEILSTSPSMLFHSAVINKDATFEWKVPKDTMLTKIQFEDDISHLGGTINITITPPK